MKNKKPVVSIIILSFNTKDLLERCLLSVAHSDIERGSIETIVVDNNSTDGSAELLSTKFTRIKLIKNRENVGFSAGNNIGIRSANGKYILLLNSDVEVEENTISTMVKFMESRKDLGAATCRLELPTGYMDPACHRGFPTPWNSFFYMAGVERLFPRHQVLGGYHQGWKDRTTPHDVDVISGAFFLIPRTVIDKVGLLDERFFMYGEDIDWCYRIKESGYRIVFNPAVKATHYKKQSGRAHHGNTALKRRTHVAFIDTMGQFYMKHYAGKYPLPVTWLVKLGIAVRKALG